MYVVRIIIIIHGVTWAEYINKLKYKLGILIISVTVFKSHYALCNNDMIFKCS